MIVQLTGTIVELTPSLLVLDVGGVGYELGISSTTAQDLPGLGAADVRVYVRMVLRQDAISLYGFSSRQERSLFDHLTAITGVGPKLALAVLSSYSPSQLVEIVAAEDAMRLSSVSGVGKKTAGRMLLELKGTFAKDIELATLAGAPAPVVSESADTGIEADVIAALLSMGFTPQEAQLALEGHEESGASSLQELVGYALRRLGSGA